MQQLNVIDFSVGAELYRSIKTRRYIQIHNALIEIDFIRLAAVTAQHAVALFVWFNKAKKTNTSISFERKLYN